MTTSIVQPLKRCAKCKRDLPANRQYFFRHSQTTDGFRPACKECEGRSFRVIVRDGYKRCSGCKRELLATTEFFNRNKAQSDGLQNYCRECYNEAAHQAYAANPAKHRAKARKQEAENPDKFRAYKQRRLARKRAVLATLTLVQWQRCLEYFDNRCTYCGKHQDSSHAIEREHVVSLSEGGGYTAYNIVPSCKSCNSSKHDTPVAEWLKRKFGSERAAEILVKIEAYFAWVANQDASA